MNTRVQLLSIGLLLGLALSPAWGQPHHQAAVEDTGARAEWPVPSGPVGHPGRRLDRHAAPRGGGLPAGSRRA